MPFSEIVDDILVSSKSKNPQVKEGTLRFLQRSLCSTTDLPGKDQIKPLAEALVALLGDSAEPVRSGAADCLGTMMKLLGERTFNPYIENVAELQMTKVKDAFGKAEVRYKAGGAKAPVKAAAPAAKKVSSSRCEVILPKLTCSQHCHLLRLQRRLDLHLHHPSGPLRTHRCRASIRTRWHRHRRLPRRKFWLAWA